MLKRRAIIIVAKNRRDKRKNTHTTLDIFVFVMCAMEIIMKTIKTLTKLLLSVMIMITSLSVTVLPVKAEPTDGEAYAVLTNEGDLIFFRSYEVYTDSISTAVIDINDNQFAGTVFSNVESGYEGKWLDNSYKELIKRVYVAENTIIKPTTMMGWFFSCYNLVSFSIEGFDTSAVTSTESMFYACSSLSNLNLNGFDTNKVTSMGYMFYKCSSLTSLDLSGFDTSNVCSMESMFSGCNYLTDLDISGFNTSEVSMMSNMFTDCWDLNSIQLGPDFTVWRDEAYLDSVVGLGWTNGNITLSVTDLYNQYPSHANEWAGEWYCILLAAESISINKTEVYLTVGDTEPLIATILPEDVTLKSINWSSSDDLIATVDEIGVVTAVSPGTVTIFAKTKDGSNISASCQVTVKAENLAYAIKLDNGDFVFFRSKNEYSNETKTTVTDINGQQFTGVVFTDVENTRESNILIPWFGYKNTIKKVYVADNTIISPNSTRYWFQDCKNLQSFNGNGLNTSNVVNMGCMFYNCKSLTYLDLSVFETENVISMQQMLRDCSQLTQVDVSSFNTRNVTSMIHMFSSCSSLTSLDLSNFDTSSVKHMNSMFSGCSSLKSLDLSSFDTSNVQEMSYLFSGCDNLCDIALGDNFTQWSDNACIPSGIWTNSLLVKTNEELYEGYPSHSSEWQGEWKKFSFDVLPADISVNVGECMQLSVVVSPENAFAGEFIWSSTDNSIVSVDDSGLITGINGGEANITVSFKNSIYSQNYPVKVSIVDIDNKTLLFGDIATIKAYLKQYEPLRSAKINYTLPDGAQQSFPLSDIGNGEYIVCFPYDDSSKAGTYNVNSITITDGEGNVMDIIDGIFDASFLMKNTLSVIAPQQCLQYTTSYTFTAIINPSTNNISGVTWSSSDTSIASINSSTGILSTKNKSGIITITATAIEDPSIYGSIDVIVSNSAIAIGETTYLGNSSYTPYSEVEWEIEDESILQFTGKRSTVSINNNYRHSVEVKGIKEGSTILKMLTPSGDVLLSANVYVYNKALEIVCDCERIVIDKSETYKLSAYEVFSDGSRKEDNIMYLSCDDDIIKVYGNGEVIPVSKGETSIKVYSNYCTPIEIPAEVVVWTNEIVVDEKIIELSENKKTHTITYEVLPSDATNKSVYFSSDDERVVKVDENGNVIAIGNGSTTVRLTAADGHSSAAISVIVNGLLIDIETLPIDFKDSPYAWTGMQIKPVFTIYDGDYTLVEGVDYETSISNGINAGMASIIIKGINRYKGTISKTFSIIKFITKIDIESTIKLNKGDIYQFNYSIYPKDATDQTIEWESLDDSIATVDNNGIIHALNSGITTIIARALDGSEVTAKCEVQVVQKIDEGRAYAVLSNDGDLIFFRSKEYYRNAEYSIVVDTQGNTYSGKVFSEFEEGYDIPWYYDRENIKHVAVANQYIISPENYGSWFSGCINMISFESEGFDLSAAFDISGMFSYCQSLTNLDLSNFSTGGIYWMSELFRGCSSLEKLDISSFDISAVEGMNDVFVGCDSLSEIVLGPGFGGWRDYAYLPEGTWDNGDISLQEWQLYDYYRNSTDLRIETWKRWIYAKSISLDKTEVTLKIGESIQLFATVKPKNANYAQQLSWISSDTSIAVVDKDGIITALSYGRVPIQVSVPDGSDVYAVCIVNVTRSGVDITDVTRIAGTNRFGTSQDIALMFKQNNNVDKLDAVILANGDNFADALAGSYLAAVKNAPIIITRAGKESEVNKYIRSILKSNGTIYVLGGTAAVPESCLNDLTGRGYDIERIAGNNRYLTNLAILDKAGVSGDTLLIATGTNYADSLSASATGLPMLLVKDSLSDEQRSFLREHRGMKLIILGGTNAVNSTVESQLGSYGEVSRISGANRAGTSLEIAKKFFPEATTAVIAYSHNFPDGLCGGPLANQIKSPLILTRDNDADATASYMKSKGIKTGYVLGGTSVLSDSLVRKLYAMRSSDKIIDFNK